MMNLLLVWYTIRSANQRVDQKHLAMDKAKSIVRQLDAIDDIVFCHNPVYNFIKTKVGNENTINKQKKKNKTVLHCLY